MLVSLKIRVVSGNPSPQSKQTNLSMNLHTLGLQHLRVREYPSTKVRILRAWDGSWVHRLGQRSRKLERIRAKMAGSWLWKCRHPEEVELPRMDFYSNTFMRITHLGIAVELICSVLKFSWGAQVLFCRSLSIYQ